MQHLERFHVNFGFQHNIIPIDITRNQENIWHGAYNRNFDNHDVVAMKNFEYSFERQLFELHHI